MDNNIMDAGLQNKQALLSVPENDEIKANRYKSFGVGSFIYALIYTICLYHNTSGITYPFFTVATVYFFGFYLRKSEKKFNSGNGCMETKRYISDRFIIISMLVTGFLNFTTDSWVLIFFNRCLIFALLSVLVIGHWYDISGWSLVAHLRAVVTIALGSFSRILSPVGDYMALKKISGDRENKKFTSVIIGLVISIPIVIIVCTMLSSADAIFGQFMGQLLNFEIDADFLSNIIGIVVMFLVIFGLSYGLIIYNQDDENRAKVVAKASANMDKWDSYIAVTVSVVVGIFYLIFSVIQIFGLFLGQMRLPEGYTYASYVHEGFYQLVFVCIFNIALVLVSLSRFERTRLLQVLLTIICGCTYIMIASSGYRMIMYVASYGLSFLRFFVLWGLVVIAFIMAGVTASIYKENLGLFKYMLVTVTVFWIIFSAMHPDYIIARYSLKYQENPDMYYLTYTLSLDALPALDTDYNYEYYVNQTKDYEKELSGFMGFRKLNVSRLYLLYRNK